MIYYFPLKVEFKVVPIKDIKHLNVSFPIPDVNPHYDSKVSTTERHIICVISSKHVQDGNAWTTLSKIWSKPNCPRTINNNHYNDNGYSVITSSLLESLFIFIGCGINL